VQTARWLGEPKVHATVRRKGRRAILRWRLKRIPGQVVTFSETGPGVPPRVIARTRAARGTRRRLRRDGAHRRGLLAAVLRIRVWGPGAPPRPTAGASAGHCAKEDLEDRPRGAAPSLDCRGV